MKRKRENEAGKKAGKEKGWEAQKEGRKQCEEYIVELCITEGIASRSCVLNQVTKDER